MKNDRRSGCGPRWLAGFILLGCAGAAAGQAPPPAQGPGVADTNKLIRIHNAYRHLLASGMKWKAPSPMECESVRRRVAMLSVPIPPLDPQVVKPNEQAGIDLQQRTEENSLTMISAIGPLVLEALALDCLELPAVSPGA